MKLGVGRNGFLFIMTDDPFKTSEELRATLTTMTTCFLELVDGRAVRPQHPRVTMAQNYKIYLLELRHYLLFDPNTSQHVL